MSSRTIRHENQKFDKSQRNIDIFTRDFRYVIPCAINQPKDNQNCGYLVEMLNENSNTDVMDITVLCLHSIITVTASKIMSK